MQRAIRNSLTLLFTAFRPSLAGDVIATGTAFVINSDGKLLTNAHVVDGSTKVIAKTGTQELPAQVVSVDNRNDDAVMMIGRMSRQSQR